MPSIPRIVLLLAALAGSPPVTAQPGKVTLLVEEAGSGAPVPARVHLRNSDGEAIRAPGLPFHRTHFTMPGEVTLELESGTYRYEVERGPEHEARQGAFTVMAGRGEKIVIRIGRLFDLNAEGWWPGDLHVHRPAEEMKLLMRAEDLHVAPVITWWNNRNRWRDEAPPADLLMCFDRDRYCHVMAGEDEREGGALLYFHLDRPLPITGAAREHPSPMKFLSLARERDGEAWIDIEKPFWWDAPVWLALGRVDSIGIANNHMTREGMFSNPKPAAWTEEAWGRPRDYERLPSPQGNGFWSQEIYYHALNTGMRIPPSAGSASGVLPNPLGYNRVWVHAGVELDYRKWWENLRAGRCFVSNGPLLRCRVDGQLPGHVFRMPAAGGVLDLDGALDARDPVARVEIVVNGRVAQSFGPGDVAGGRLRATIRIDESGWFLVRAIADNPENFQFASTGPFYVEVGGAAARVSRSSARFFLDWVRERRDRIRLDDPVEQAAVMSHHHEAERFWKEKVAAANVE